MAKKKSLGHNPLAYSMRGHASFDFIQPSEEKKEGEERSEKDDKKSKMVVSYYLEEDLVQDIKDEADKKGMSYSAFINQLLKKVFKSQE